MLQQVFDEILEIKGHTEEALMIILAWKHLSDELSLS